MPTYVFKCAPHNHQFEVQLGFTDPAPEVCAVCGEAPIKKVFLPVGVTFKGSGFYKTDSRGGSASTSTPAKDAGKEGGSSASGDSTSSAGSSGSSGSSTPAATPAPAAPSSPAPSSTT